MAEIFPIPLTPAQEQAAKDWAADDRLWTTQETVEFNLRTFARVILQHEELRISSLEALIQEWRPIETAPKDGTVILRPHRIWGAMDVRYITDAQQDAKNLVLAAGINWQWLNGDYTTAWTDEAFLPFWMPLPRPPKSAHDAACEAELTSHGYTPCQCAERKK